ncbi:MAG: hypothetical protein HN348_12670 [Proteobacteria bacterium]|nr:hypothetical protein [Pseudomonadota bacterium]
MLLATQLEQGVVIPWRIEPHLLAELSQIEATWRLGQHDLLFGGLPERVWPCPRSVWFLVRQRRQQLAEKYQREIDAYIKRIRENGFPER